MAAPLLPDGEAPPAPGYSPLGGLRVNPDGTVSYDFDGRVHAKGLDLDATAGLTPPDANRVRWLRTDTGAVVADIAGRHGGLEVTATDTTGGTATVDAIFGMRSPPNTLAAGYWAQASPALPGGSRLAFNAGGEFRTLFGGDGASTFLQLAVEAKREIAFGNAGGVPAGAAQAVAHGLGVTPIAVVITPHHGGGADIRGVVMAVDATNLTIKNNGGVASNFMWVAVG